MKKQRNNKSRTEAILSVIITTALVLTLALTIATAINKGSSEDNNNIVDLNETDSYNAQLNNEEMTTQGQTENAVHDNKLADNTAPTEKNSETPLSDDSEEDTDPDADDNGNADNSGNAETDSAKTDIAVDVSDSVTSNLSFSENSTLYWPVVGDVILKYNMDNTIWFPTLGVYKCNPAIYIASEAGTAVSSSCTGVVETIYSDEETGTNMVVSIGNGYTLTYGQISNLQFVKGDIVKAGDTIGYVADPSIYYTEEGSGLYFKVECDGEPCDPMLFLE